MSQEILSPILLCPLQKALNSNIPSFKSALPLKFYEFETVNTEITRPILGPILSLQPGVSAFWVRDERLMKFCWVISLGHKLWSQVMLSHSAPISRVFFTHITWPISFFCGVHATFNAPFILQWFIMDTVQGVHSKLTNQINPFCKTTVHGWPFFAQNNLLGNNSDAVYHREKSCQQT